MKAARTAKGAVTTRTAAKEAMQAPKKFAQIQVTYFIPYSVLGPLSGLPPGVQHKSDPSPKTKAHFHIVLAPPSSGGGSPATISSNDVDRIAQSGYVKTIWEGQFAGHFRELMELEELREKREERKEAKPDASGPKPKK